MEQKAEMHFTGRSLYKSDHSVYYSHDDGLGSNLRAFFEPTKVTLQTAWPGVGCANYVIFFNMVEENIWDKFVAWLKTLNPYISLVLFNPKSCNILESYEQVHDNDAGSGEREDFSERAFLKWNGWLDLMVKSTPSSDLATRLVLKRVQQVFSLLQLV